MMHRPLFGCKVHTYIHIVDMIYKALVNNLRNVSPNENSGTFCVCYPHLYLKHKLIYQVGKSKEKN